MSDKSYDAAPHIANIHDSVKRHFIQNGICMGCNLPTSKHRVLMNNDVDDTWFVCWTEGGMGAHGPFKKHFCIRAEDHPGHESRDDFEELYGDA